MRRWLIALVTVVDPGRAGGLVCYLVSRPGIAADPGRDSPFRDRPDGDQREVDDRCRDAGPQGDQRTAVTSAARSNGLLPTVDQTGRRSPGKLSG